MFVFVFWRPPNIQLRVPSYLEEGRTVHEDRSRLSWKDLSECFSESRQYNITEPCIVRKGTGAHHHHNNNCTHIHHLYYGSSLCSSITLVNRYGDSRLVHTEEKWGLSVAPDIFQHGPHVFLMPGCCCLLLTFLNFFFVPLSSLDLPLPFTNMLIHIFIFHFFCLSFHQKFWLCEFRIPNSGLR